MGPSPQDAAREEMLAIIQRSAGEYQASLDRFFAAGGSRDDALAKIGVSVFGATSVENLKTDAPQGQVQSAQRRNTLKAGFQVLGGMILVLGLVYAVCLAALHTHFHIHRDTKHKHKDNTAPGTQVLKDRGGDDLTMSLTTVHHSGDAAICGLLHGDFGADPVDLARSLGGVNDITLAYQGAEAQHLLHLRVGSIRHSVPDDLEDAEAVVGEINSVSGDFNLVLQQGGVVSVKEDGELFATEVVCEVADHEQRRRLFSWDDLNPFSTTTGSTPATGKNGHYYSM